ncbi:hypothetical protein ncot_08705 [Nocardioides sp. JQ2195]|uniref:hypothetical protein n=1 Tax=Nocardioides sp. JQ2195 TaxID=2592334 RepID=UPI00143ED499|nr:hypothetical protein [Nocardioides sp. JQ2195]QIX26675.1 hypothetical protein ncot_08705 [Nocardioides sp. JQ2195]
MNRAVPLTVAVLMLLAGMALWFTGVDREGRVWAFIGPVLAGFGIALLIVTFQRKD